MDQTPQHLYEQEISIYKTQNDLLKKQLSTTEQTNEALSKKVQTLQELIEQANVANKDLHTAFEHMRQENLKLQVGSDPQEQHTPDSASVISNETNDNLQRHYATLALESVSWISDKEKLSQKVNFLERECERYTRDNSTLAKQVRHLLRALEEERGMIIRRSNEVTEYNQQITSLDVIDNNLVTFESIEELQLQNQKLLSLVKKLAKEDEDRETKIENEDIKRLNNDIETLKTQLEDVKNERERIVNAFNMILKERDLFKILLCRTRQVEHMTPEIFQRMVSIACSSGPAIESVSEDSCESKNSHISDLKAMISKLENELKEVREQFDDSKRRSDDEIKLKTELLEKATVKFATESQQVTILTERNQVLEDNLKALTNEFEEIRAKSNKMTFEFNESITKIRDLESQLQEMNNLRNKCALQETQIASLTVEINQSRTSSERIIDELHKHIDDIKNNSEANAIQQANWARRELLGQFEELQRLRNIEREEKLKLARRFFKVTKPIYQPIIKTDTNSKTDTKTRAKNKKTKTKFNPPPDPTFNPKETPSAEMDVIQDTDVKDQPSSNLQEVQHELSVPMEATQDVTTEPVKKFVLKRRNIN